MVLLFKQRQQAEGVYGGTIHSHAPVQMRAGCASGCADPSDDIPLGYGLTILHRNSVKVEIHAEGITAMVDID